MNGNVKEFFEIYEKNRYKGFKNFVNTDSMLHTYHLYFDYLIKQIEKGNLYKKVESFIKKVADTSENVKEW